MFWHRNTGEVYVKDVKVGGAAAAAGVQPDRKEIRKTLICGTLICRWKGTTVLTIQNLRSIIHHVNGQPIKGMDTRKVRDQILGVCVCVCVYVCVIFGLCVSVYTSTQACMRVCSHVKSSPMFVMQVMYLML